MSLSQRHGATHADVHESQDGDDKKTRLPQRKYEPESDSSGRVMGRRVVWGGTQRLRYHLPGEQYEGHDIERSKPDMALVCGGKRAEVRKAKLRLKVMKSVYNDSVKNGKLTGRTRRLRGCGGKIGTMIRRMTKAEDRKDTKARARAGMRGSILFVIT